MQQCHMVVSLWSQNGYSKLWQCKDGEQKDHVGVVFALQDIFMFELSGHFLTGANIAAVKLWKSNA